MKTAVMSPVTISLPIAIYPQQPLRPRKISFAGENNTPVTVPTPPYKSRSASSASASSTASTPDLQSLALNLLHTLYNDHNLSHASTLIHPNVTLTHNDSPITMGSAGSREAYIDYWRSRVQKLGPGLKAHWREAVVDEAQRKVWCVGEVSVGNRRKESVDMLSFDEQGRLVGEEDWVRAVKSRRQNEDD